MATRTKTAKVTPPPQRAWSFSAWAMYEECPQRYLWDRVERRAPEEAKGPALVRGDAVHKEAELYVRRRNARAAVPASLKLYTVELRDLIKHDAVPEGQWAFARDWTPRGWFDNDVWLRVKLDVWALYPKAILRVIDHKTGRVYGDKVKTYDAQLGLYALAAMQVFSDITTVEAQLWFLDHHVTTKRVYKVTDEPALRAEWEERVAKMLSDRRFAPVPGAYCTWCPFSRSKGGECRY